MQRVARALAVAVVVAVLALAGFWIARSGSSGDGEPAGSATDAPATASGPVLPEPTASSPAGTAEPTASGTAGPPGVDVLEPGPGAPVATDEQQTPLGGNVDVEVTFAGWDDVAAGVEVSGYVSGVVEAGGTCTLALSRGSTTRTAQGSGDSDASTTTCGTLQIPGTDLSAGEWTAVLTYASATSSGSSVGAPVQVPNR
jgi:hypothetical protein